MDDLLTRTGQAWEWLTQRWAIDQTPALPVFLVALVALVAACAYRPVWVTLRHAVTIVHEMGHVLMAWLFGRRIDGIRLHNDTSGLTITAGKERGLGMLMTYLSGYTAPPLVGLALVWASITGWAGAALTAIMALLLAAFWLVRNPFGLVTVVLALAGSGVVFWQAEPTVVTTYTVVVGLFLLLASVRGGFDLWSLHSRGEAQTSDASMAARHSLLPAMAWVWFFAIVGVLCTLQAGNLVITSLL